MKKSARSGPSTKTALPAISAASRDAHLAHLRQIQRQVMTDLRRKYLKGQKEHGGNLWQKPGLLDEAINEALDLVVYLYTLRGQE